MTNINLKIKAGISGLIFFVILLIISFFTSAQRAHFNGTKFREAPAIKSLMILATKSKQTK